MAQNNDMMTGPEQAALLAAATGVFSGVYDPNKKTIKLSDPTSTRAELAAVTRVLDKNGVTPLSSDGNQIVVNAGLTKAKIDAIAKDTRKGADLAVFAVDNGGLAGKIVVGVGTLAVGGVEWAGEAVLGGVAAGIEKAKGALSDGDEPKADLAEAARTPAAAPEQAVPTAASTEKKSPAELVAAASDKLKEGEALTTEESQAFLNSMGDNHVSPDIVAAINKFESKGVILTQDQTFYRDLGQKQANADTAQEKLAAGEKLSPDETNLLMDLAKEGHLKVSSAVGDYLHEKIHGEGGEMAKLSPLENKLLLERADQLGREAAANKENFFEQVGNRANGIFYNGLRSQTAVIPTEKPATEVPAARASAIATPSAKAAQNGGGGGRKLCLGPVCL